MVESNNQIAVFGGGCFWCTEAVFKKLKGVVSVVSGYAGGSAQNPNYSQVSRGITGHAEVIKIEFNPKVVNFRDLLEVFFAMHDPTTPNQQEAEKIISEIADQKIYNNPIVTEIKPLEQFYEAEDYHQDYFNKNPSQPYCQVVINPKLDKFKKKFTSLLK